MQRKESNSGHRAEPVTDEQGREIVLPVPREMEYLDYLPLDAACVVLRKGASSAERSGVGDFIARVECLGGGAPAVREAGADTSGYSTVIALGVAEPADVLSRDLPEPRRSESYVIAAEPEKKPAIVKCTGGGARGAFYAMQTLSQLLNRRGGKVVLRGTRVRDWPAFEVRLIPHDGGVADSEEMVDTYIGCMDYISRYKLNTYGTGKGTKWQTWSDEDLSGDLRKRMKKLINYARDTGTVDFLQYVHVGERMSVSDSAQLDSMKTCLLFALREGARHIGVLADDFARYTEEDEEAFGPKYPSGWAAAHAHLMNMIHEAVRDEFPDAMILYCPPEWWTKGLSYAGPPWKMIGTQELSRRIPQDIGIIWTGLRVMWRELPEDVLAAWPAYMCGHKPFLWENTIYSRWRKDIGAFWLFNPFDNALPENLPELLYKGIHLNTGPSALNRLGWVTFACYAWNPESYRDPWKTMDIVLRKEYGGKLAGLFHEFRETFVDIMYIVADLYPRRLSEPDLKRMPGMPDGPAHPAGREEATALYRRLEEVMKEIRSACGNEALVNELENGFVKGRIEFLKDRIEDRFFAERIVTLRDFDVAGPFPNEDGAGIDTAYPPEAEPALDGSASAQRRSAGWEKKHLPPEQHLQVKDYLSFDEPNVVWYAAAAVVAPDERTTEMVVKSRSALKVFVNGDEVYRGEPHPEPDARMIRMHRFPISLRSGDNRLLIKLAAGDEETKLLARVGDTADGGLAVQGDGPRLT